MTEGGQLAPLFTAAAVRELDRAAIEQAGIPAEELMHRAGAAAWEVLRDEWPDAGRVLVLSGSGNNGGDGFVVAGKAAEAGLDASLCVFGEREHFSPEARCHLEAALAAGARAREFDDCDLGAQDVIVDALLGTGLRRDVGGEIARVIRALNRAGRPVLSLDLPSGLNADTGAVLGVAVRAAVTVTFVGRKQGLYTAAAADHRGRVRFSDLAVPPAAREAVAASATLLDQSIIAGLLRPRQRAAHKGDCGHVLVVGGDVGYSGAARMAAEAAARAGAGLVSVATHPDNAQSINIGRPELMVRGCAGHGELSALLGVASVVAIGPGLGRGEWGRDMLAHALSGRHPLVVDADALNIIAGAPVERDNWVLTPHPGEAARLLDCGTAEVQRDRFQAARAIQRRFGGSCILKGSGTLVATPEDLYVSPLGNPGMASGGMGDVLTGICAGLVAQGFEPDVAAVLGVLVHGAAGDAAAAGGERGLLALDLMAALRPIVNPP